MAGWPPHGLAWRKKHSALFLPLSDTEAWPGEKNCCVSVFPFGKRMPACAWRSIFHSGSGARPLAVATHGPRLSGDVEPRGKFPPPRLHGGRPS